MFMFQVQPVISCGVIAMTMIFRTLGPYLLLVQLVNIT